MHVPTTMYQLGEEINLKVQYNEEAKTLKKDFLSGTKLPEIILIKHLWWLKRNYTTLSLEISN